MSLTLLCATRAEACARPFLVEMANVARACEADFAVVLNDRAAADRWQTCDIAARVSVASEPPAVLLQHLSPLMQQQIDQATTDYILVLDDDERCTPNLTNWLIERRYYDADFWFIPRAWLYQDRRHYICSRKHWPNPALRIGRRSCIRVPTTPIHAGWLDGTGTRAQCPHSLEHHKLLLRSLDVRTQEVEQREVARTGAGMFKQYLPERLMVDVAEWAG